MIKLAAVIVSMVGISMAAQTPVTPAPANTAIVGTWKMNISIMDTPLSETCTLKMDGTTLRGVCKSEDSEADLLGEIDGSNVVWKHTVAMFGTVLVYAYKGKIEDDQSMSGSMMVEEIGTGAPFTAKKELTSSTKK